MSDQYDSIRSLSLQSVAPTLGIDLSGYKKRKGGELYGPCPVHKPKANQTSFSYAPDGKWHCFSCEAKGRGAIDLAMQVLHIGFKEACERLGGVKPIPEPEELPREDCGASGTTPESEDDVPEFKSTYAKFFVENEWLTARVPSVEVVRDYGVGYYFNPGRKSKYQGKVLMPIRNGRSGSVVGYLARSIVVDDKNPKYLFPANLPKSLFLFGAYEIRQGKFGPAPLKKLWVVESPFCVLKYALMGIPAVSPFGWHVSVKQMNTLTELAKGVIYLPDHDKYEQGKEVAASLASKLWVKYPELPEGVQDPEALTKDQVLAL